MLLNSSSEFSLIFSNRFTTSLYAKATSAALPCNLTVRPLRQAKTSRTILKAIRNVEDLNWERKPLASSQRRVQLHPFTPSGSATAVCAVLSGFPSCRDFIYGFTADQ